MGKWDDTEEAYFGEDQTVEGFSARQGVEVGKAVADGLMAGSSKFVSLSAKEVEILKSCIYMSAAEGFYQFDRIDLDVSEEDIKSILRSLGLSKADVEEFMERVNSL